MSASKWKNPFYTLLIPVGLAFVITAIAYGIMASLAVSGTKPEIQAHLKGPVFTWLAEHGTHALFIELGALAVLTFGAIATEGWWSADEKPNSNPPAA